MKWRVGMTVTRVPYTALVADDESREFGRYLHVSAGFVPLTTNNNARARKTEAEAREFVLRRALERAQQEAAELLVLLGSLQTAASAGAQCSTENGVEQGGNAESGERRAETLK